MRFSAIIFLSAIGLAMAAPAAEPALEGEELMARQSTLGCVYGNNQCPAKCRAVYGRSCPGSYCNAPSAPPYGSCICRCAGGGPV